ncbi:poly [ADP-ribose] polymerase tankyrase-2-like [Juglans microcarpa x Juglans regia]|uniref:poly [ADP-ribose] polymerase tankyrase-2-like n=1 Tax=Juglans microcarpa x Juglans regia TaxID=2249226 RepID=UPI001B7E0C94|nr:poly [ADP-ribose] polymerase tankyrase-2-like [Juglans microcarpa x Juglans regia]
MATLSPVTFFDFNSYSETTRLISTCLKIPFSLFIRMTQTPLHVSAGYNRVEIVKFLLDRQGTSHKVELEAKNMYGETPLHMAAKNGCNDAAQLLWSWCHY